MRYATLRSFPAFAKTGLVLLMVLGMFAACEEIGPTLNLQESGQNGGTSDLETQPRGVLIEEFTGVRCVNCPAGAEALEQLIGIHGSSLVAVSLHAGFFSNPYTDGSSRVDFRRPESDAIEVLVGGPQGYPSAVINRKAFPGEFGLQLSRNSWAGYIAQELTAEPLVAIGLQPTFDSVARVVTVDVSLLGRAGTGSRDVSLTVLLLESNIADAQLTPEGREDDYLHMHALRESFTSPTGESVGALLPGATAERTYSMGLPSDYVAANLEVVAFVHYSDLEADGKEVLQAVGAKL